MRIFYNFQQQLKYSSTIHRYKLYQNSIHIRRLLSNDSNLSNNDSNKLEENVRKLPQTPFARKKPSEKRPPSNIKYDPADRENNLQKAFDYCIEELSKEEPQISDTLQYLKCKNDHQRLGIIVLRVLHLELSRTRSDANTADAARIRLQWWKSAMSEIINENSIFEQMKESTPLLTALRVVKRRYNLNSNWLMKLITAREMFLSSNTFMSMLELEEYAENTQTILLYLSMECLGLAYTSEKQIHFKCASHIGVFMTIASVLRSIPYSVKNGFIALPDDIAADCDVWRFEQTVLDENKSTLQLKNAVQKMVINAYTHLYAARDLEKEGMSNEAKSVFLCSIPAQRYLINLEKCGFDVFNETLFNMDMGLSWKWELMRKSMKNTF